MSLLENIQSNTPNVKNRGLILKAFGNVIEKARSGVYSDNPVNRKLKRVGQKYGTKKQVEQPGGKVKKQEENKPVQKKYDPEKIKEYAKNASEQTLQLAIKNHKDENVRKVAHQELERRKKEEYPQKEDKGKVKEGDKKEVSKDNVRDKDRELEKEINDLEKEIVQRRKDLSKIDDIEKIIEESNKTQELIDKRKQLIENQKSLRKVPFKEYMKGFKDFSQEEPKKIGEYYGKGALEVDKYLKKNKDVDDAIDFYTRGDGYKNIRNYLGDKDNYLNTINENNRDNVNIKTSKLIDNISKFIQDNKLKENLVLNRRVGGDGLKFFQQLEKGDIYEDKSFSSTSLRELTHFGDYNISILAKKDSNVANVSNLGEVEYLIDKGSKFRVLDKNDYGLIVELL